MTTFDVAVTIVYWFVVGVAFLWVASEPRRSPGEGDKMRLFRVGDRVRVRGVPRDHLEVSDFNTMGVVVERVCGNRRFYVGVFSPDAIEQAIPKAVEPFPLDDAIEFRGSD